MGTLNPSLAGDGVWLFESLEMMVFSLSSVLRASCCSPPVTPILFWCKAGALPAAAGHASRPDTAGRVLPPHKAELAGSLPDSDPRYADEAAVSQGSPNGLKSLQLVVTNLLCLLFRLGTPPAKRSRCPTASVDFALAPSLLA